MRFDLARRIADTVLYEGYVLYPYRASAAKNRVRFQFGVLVPPVFAAAGTGESSSMQTECLVEPADAARLEVRIRCLQLRRRTLEPQAEDVPSTWDEGIEREMDLPTLEIAELVGASRGFDISLPGGREVEALPAHGGVIRVIREWWPVAVRAQVAAEVDATTVRVQVRIENLTDWTPDGSAVPAIPGDRDAALRQSLVGVHTLMAVTGGAFVSLLDPPAHAADAAARCHNAGTWPVLVGDPGQRDTLLSSPIILYDYPAVAPESQGDFCDGTEIDELLALRVMTLTDAEKAEARATDARAKDILDRADSLPPEVFDRLHGAIRSLQAARDGAPARRAKPAPEDETLRIGNTEVSKGARVRLKPKRRADSMDLFLAGMTARVEGVYRDVDDRTWVAVTVEDDPAADMHTWYGRFLYFYPDEIEPLGVSTPPLAHERKAEP